VSRETRSTVRLAYLELMAPTLDEAIDALAAQGATAIRVVPVFLAAGGHVTHDLPHLVQGARRRHPSLSLEIDPPIGEQHEVLAAIAAAISSRAPRGP
jgi:sirohydrochlorin cobaltochelatase